MLTIEYIAIITDVAKRVCIVQVGPGESLLFPLLNQLNLGVLVLVPSPFQQVNGRLV
jgi:hypothetical protein